MEIKKTYEADLENDKSSFVLMGLLIAFCTVFIGFEMAQRGGKIIEDSDMQEEVAPEEEIEVPITEQENTPPPPPPPAPEPEIPEPTNNIVKNEEAQTVKFESTEKQQDVPAPAKEALNEPVEVKPEEDIDQILFKVEKKAEYPGGMKALGAFLSQNLVYPKAALEAGISGTVYVKFTVNRDGTVQDVEIVRSIDPNLDKEAMRVVKMMKGWKPAQNNSKTVRSKFQLPIKFSIN